MTKLDLIERQIAGLDRSDRRKLMAWLAEFVERDWDRQIGEDVKAGRLDRALAEAREEVKAGKFRPL